MKETWAELMQRIRDALETKDGRLLTTYAVCGAFVLGGLDGLFYAIGGWPVLRNLLISHLLLGGFFAICYFVQKWIEAGEE